VKSIYDFDPTFPNADFRVGFIGSHCVGKTTQVKKLGRLLRIPTITEGVRQVVTAMGYANIGDVPDKVLMQWKILQYQIRHEQEFERFISDRTTLDNAAYFHAYNQDVVSTREYWAYMDAARDHAKTYTHLIYFPLAWDNVEADGFRDTDPGERKRIDDIVRTLIDDWNVNRTVYTVTQDDLRDGPAARIHEILEHLNLWQAARELGVLTPGTTPKEYQRG